MNTKPTREDKDKAWAQKELDKIMPREKFIKLRNPDEKRLKLYDHNIDYLTKIAKGEEKIIRVVELKSKTVHTDQTE